MAQSADFDGRYREIVAMNARAMKEGHGPAYYAGMKRILTGFQNAPDEAAAFLVKRVAELDAEERHFVRSNDDYLGYSEYGLNLLKKGQSPVTRDTLLFMLAELYPNVRSDTKESTLRVIAKGYAPFILDKARKLDWTLLRIGQDGVVTSLNLADGTNQRVRCHATEHLNGVARSVTEARVEGGSKPPVLDCVANEVTFGQAVSSWRAWWKETGSSLPFPKVMSMFEQPVASNRAK
jgi:hypothetical protein